MKTLVTIVLSLAWIFPASGVARGQAGVGRAFSLDMLRSTQTRIGFVLPAVFQFPEESSEDARPTRYNFWNAGVDPYNGNGGPGNQNWIASSAVVNATNITYTLPGGPDIITFQVGVPPPGSSECGPPIAGTKKVAKVEAQSAAEDSSSCTSMLRTIMSLAKSGQWAEAYDSNQYFVEHCYTNQYAAGALNSSDNLVQNGALGAAPGCWEQNLQWLLSVLPLRHDAQWFCADVGAVAGSLMESADTTWQQVNTGTNRTESVIYWLIHNSPCDNSSLEQYYSNSRGSQIESWTNSGCGCPLDTTIYTLHDLGLESILKYAALLGVHEPGMADIISNAAAYPNPTGEGTIVSFGMSKEAYVIIRLFDVLGHNVTVSGFGGVVQAGNLSVPLSLQGLPAGTYYARIQTTYGDVQTVKLVKQ